MGWIVETTSADETMAFGKMLGAGLGPGSVLALRGDLGAGKTCLVKGLAQHFGVSDAHVTSPTYALFQEYEGKPCPVLHFDFYRLEGFEHACALGLDEMVGRVDGVSVVEWAELIPELMPRPVWYCSLQVDGSRRRIYLHRAEA